jgi:ribosomal protein S18 acetylase RimI-like enzyme
MITNKMSNICNACLHYVRSVWRIIPMVKIAPLSVDFRVRPATMGDLNTVLRVQIAQESADFGEPLSNKTSLRNIWQSEGINLKKDTWVVETSDEHIVGYAYVRERTLERFFVSVWVLPHYQKHGIGRHLLHLAETHVRERITEAPPDIRITLTAIWISERNQAAQHILIREGYQRMYSLSSMQLDLNIPPPVPVWNNGIVVRPFRPGEDEHALYEADEAISQEERTYIPRTREVWQQQSLSDPALIFLAWDAKKIAGFVIGGTGNDNQGWIWHLGVQHPWRKRGLGMALLQQAQGEFYRRGMHTMKLNVDPLNVTGAFRLYERAGMRTLFQYHRFEKEL